MQLRDTLVSICLPIRNGGPRAESVIRAVLAQDHPTTELVISDNASTDETGDICRDLARSDSRIVYLRQPENIGLLNNFIAAMRQARGTFFRWVGDGDWIAPTYVSRCLEQYATDDRLVVVTTAIEYVGDDGVSRTGEYQGHGLSSDDPVERFEEMLRLLNISYLVIDPLYGLMRRSAVVGIPRRNMLREDEIYATKLALAGPWAHVNEVLARRGWTAETLPGLARRLGVPVWTAHAATTLQGRDLLRWV